MNMKKTLLDELNLLRESANAIQLRRNFEDSPMLYVPEVYPDYCSESMMVMERIYGIPVSDVEALEARGTNMQLLAERGVQVFFTRVFRDSFFHADMHPRQHIRQLRASGRSAVYRHRLRYCRLTEQRR